jgi:hypothetical protein
MVYGNVNGKITLLRVHDLGSKYGPPGDILDVEVIVKVDKDPDAAYGFQLRQDNYLPAREGMFQLLKGAFANNWTVFMDWTAPQGAKNRRIFRVWVTK